MIIRKTPEQIERMAQLYVRSERVIACWGMGLTRLPRFVGAALDATGFEIMLIPHTLGQTTLGALKPGRRVNLEMDMIGKYVQRFLTLGGSTA